jgi:hypothetical protein
MRHTCVRLAAVALLLLFTGTMSAQDAQVASAAPSPVPQTSGSFVDRLANYYGQDWRPAPPDPNAPAAPMPAMRVLPSPIDSPPFPFADWPYGGSQEIGAPDSNSYPLMTAINGAKGRTKVYGWIEPGVDGSTSSHTNFPASYDVYPNRIELDQAVVYVERLADTVQTRHFDWGYHLTAFFGTDYHFTTGKGYLSQQLLQNKRQYGFDAVMEYVDLYVPHVAQGMDVRIGRFISVPGIEAQLAPNNYMYSHSLLYLFDPFTDTGAIATIKLNQQWLVQAGITDGHDVAPWTSDATPSATFCLDYTTANARDNFYACANGINNGKYRYDNVQQYDSTWWHRFSKTFHMGTESWYMYQRDVPSVTGTVPIETGTFGATCLAGEQRCTAPEWAVVNYVEKKLSPSAFLSLRTDFVDDKKGQRSGFATRYTEDALSVSKNFGSTVTLRPELRFDHAYDAPAYDAGHAHSQFIAASDVIFHF